MKPADNRVVRCAIYTRVSTDSGLDQEFNSLDAQYDASQAYIRSQAHAGWSLVKARFDDGGFSGGSTDRPALQRLLADVTAHRIHIIVVYKVDRLTRSLADFAKLVELFDAHDVSFVSVTQQFNTTTSMGRLTLNVLLSFAQFEREVTSERIRDYVSAPCIRGQPDEPVGSVTRLPASEIEVAISKAVIANTDVDEPVSNDTLSRETLERFVTRIEVRKSQLAINLRFGEGDIQRIQNHYDPDPAEHRALTSRMIVVPWKKPSRPAREILLPANTPEHRVRPMKAERRSALIRSIGRGRLWLQEIVDGRETIENLAARQHCSTRHINMTLSLAFLAPTLVTAAVEGRFPRGIGVAALRDAPAEWSQQMRRLGLAPTGATDGADR